MAEMHSEFEVLRERVMQFSAARDWQIYHNPKNLIMALMGELGELAEVFQWLTPEEAMAATSHEELGPSVEDEIADIFIYLVTLAGVLEIDLVDVAEAKVNRNEERFPVRKDSGC